MTQSKREWVFERDLVLLVPASTVQLPGDLPVLDVAGQRLYRVQASQLPGGLADWPYTCVSYASGDGTAEHPFEAGRRISARALASLAAVVRASESLRGNESLSLGKSRAFWVDFACLPQATADLAPLLRQLGSIYARANHVMAVLTQSGELALGQSAQRRALELAALEELERDDWVTRAWTYQEIVNSPQLSFVSVDQPAVIVDAKDLFNHLGKALSDWRRSQGKDSFDTRTHFARLDGLEDVLSDYVMGSSYDRCAYQVLSSMYRRLARAPEQFFEAMLGAIAAAPERMDGSSDFRSLFFSLCDERNDFSYVFAVGSGERDGGPRWRPGLGPLQAVLPWHSSGPGQKGRLLDGRLQLEDMFLPQPGPITSNARELVRSWVKSQHALASESQSLPEATYSCLKQAGFTGSGNFIECDAGYFFLQSPAPEGLQPCTAIATGVRWVQGAPGLLLQRCGDGPHRFCCPGAFIGLVPSSGEPIDMADD